MKECLGHQFEQDEISSRFDLKCNKDLILVAKIGFGKVTLLMGYHFLAPTPTKKESGIIACNSYEILAKEQEIQNSEGVASYYCPLLSSHMHCHFPNKFRWVVFAGNETR